jgi:hypothetical protein
LPKLWICFAVLLWLVSARLNACRLDCAVCYELRKGTLNSSEI